ncbi:hypothetical protein ACOMHN_061390 [Nucella lapillus]
MRNMTLYHANVNLTSLDAAYVLISNLTCIASISGCLLTTLLYLMHPDIRTTARKLLVCLGVANFIQNIAGILQAATYYKTLEFPDEWNYLCQLAASISVIGHVSSALWTCAVTLYLFMFFTLRATTVANQMVYVFYAFCFGVPVLLSLAGRLCGVYGYDVTDILSFQHPAVCWISDRVANSLQWSLLTMEGWVIAAFFLCLLLFVVINCSLYCQSGRQRKGLSPVSSSEDMVQHMTVMSAASQLRYVPLIYCMLRVWGTAHFLFTEYPVSRHLRAFDWLLVIRAFGDNLQGLANCILFCLTTSKIRRMVTRNVRRWFGCCCTWCQRQKRRLAEEKWMSHPIVRMSRSMGRPGSRTRSLDGSDLDISGISLELPSVTPEDLEEVKYTEDEVLFER